MYTKAEVERYITALEEVDGAEKALVTSGLLLDDETLRPFIIGRIQRLKLVLGRTA